MTIGGYLTALITVASVTAIASALAAEGKTKRHVNFLLSIVVMLVLVTPLTSLIDAFDPEGWLPTEGETSTDAGGALLRVCEQEIKIQLCDALALDAGEVDVKIHGQVAKDGTVLLDEVTVLLSGESRTAREAVWLYLSETIPKGCTLRVLLHE